MSDHDTILARIGRIYAAINAVTDPDLSKVKVTRRPGVLFSVNLDLPQEQLRHIAYSTIHSIASFRDHLRGFARRNERDAERVDASSRASLPLRVIIDLDEADKHGGEHRRDGGYSKRQPWLGELIRGIRMMPATRGVAGEVTFNSEGLPIAHGMLSPRVEVTGPVLDAEGQKIGDLVELVEEAVAAWERLLQEWGVAIPR